MADEGESERLLSDGLAAFNVSALTATAVVTLYWRGGLAAFLQEIGTLKGGALFAWLWLTTWFCTRRALRGLSLLGLGARFPPRRSWLAASSGEGSMGCSFSWGSSQALACLRASPSKFP
jgi:hypothetical protein